MNTEARDPALAALVAATVRVGSGSGVLIRSRDVVLVATAAHVLEGDVPPIVRRGSIYGEAPVVGRDYDLDLALVVPPRQLEALAIELANDEDARPGDPVWAAGFPRGWNGSAPVIAAGTIAGLDEESWVNIGGTWGTSGGPLCVVGPNGPRVAGILLGRAGEVNERLQTLRKRVVEQHEKAKARPVMVGGYVAWIDFDLQGAMGILSMARENAELLDEHFRTGFLRFAPVADLRKLL